MNADVRSMKKEGNERRLGTKANSLTLYYCIIFRLYLFSD